MFHQKSSNPLPAYPRISSRIEEDLCIYEIKTGFADINSERTNDIVAKILLLMKQEHMTYQDAMYVPAALKSQLSLSLQQHILASIVLPLSDDGDDQRNNGDQKREN